MKLLPRLCQNTKHKINRMFVPDSPAVNMKDLSILEKFINDSKKLLVLTGAGLSTESGIPDYRSDKVGLYARTDKRPMQYVDFIKSATARQRYWARNFVGWPKFSSFQPNISHKVLNQWEDAGKVTCLVTQNVDALHSKAGSENVIELHGCSHRVVCLSCPHQIPRDELQMLFELYNPSWFAESMSEQLAPDGDVMLSEEQVADFKVPSCPKCGGVLKPDVIFFGDNVPRKTVDKVFDKVDQCDSFLVAGSSLFVYSGYRFIQRAAELSKPTAVINIGPTRGDHLVNYKVNARCGDVLPKIHIKS